VSSRLASFTVFVAAGAVLVLETLAGRLLAPYIGVTLQTFTGIIGVVLAGIAMGTFVGGRMADRSDPRRLLPIALAAGGVLAVATVPLIRLFGPGADGSVPSIVLLSAVSFLLPSAALSAVSPLVVKIVLADVDHTGTVVGRLSAMGTAGSLVAVFVTGFVFVAAFPTTPVIVVMGALLVMVAGVVWWRLGRVSHHDPIVGCVLALVAVGWSGGEPPVRRATWRAPTSAPWCRSTPSGRRGGSWCSTSLRNSYVDLADPTHLEFSYAQIMGDVIESHRSRRHGAIDTAHVGGGGFTMPRYDRGHPTRLDQRRVRARPHDRRARRGPARDWCRAPTCSSPVTGDARVHVRSLLEPASLDLVIGDAFGGEAVPWHLTTVRVRRPDPRRRCGPAGCMR
jgi:MFS family permease